MALKNLLGTGAVILQTMATIESEPLSHLLKVQHKSLVQNCEKRFRDLYESLLLNICPMHTVMLMMGNLSGPKYVCTISPDWPSQFPLSLLHTLPTLERTFLGLNGTLRTAKQIVDATVAVSMIGYVLGTGDLQGAGDHPKSQIKPGQNPYLLVSVY